jgi:histidine triad (HIT) family protein
MELNDCIFSKIVRKEIKVDLLYEDDEVMAFRDINPVAPVHILVVPKKKYINFIDFTNRASDKEILGYYKSIKNIVVKVDLKDGSFRMLSNNGEYSGQTVMYFHTHIIGGKELGELV